MSNDASPGFTTTPPADDTDPSQGRAQTAREETGKVASEAAGQARKLVGQATSELAEQAAAQQQRLAASIRALGEELTSMSENQETGGVAGDLVGQAGQRADGVADWFENRDPGSVLDEVTRFARRRPGVFIGVAAAAGVLAGRLTRSIVEVAKDESAAAAASPASTSAPSNTSTSGATTSSPFADAAPASGAGVPPAAPFPAASTGTDPAATAAATPGTPLADQAWAETHR